MGLFERFNFWKKKVESPVLQNEPAPIDAKVEPPPAIQASEEKEDPVEIPRHVFIEEADPDETNFQNDTFMNANGEYKGIEKVYAFLQADYESKGYNDAISNPDDNYKNESVKLLKMDLEIIIQQASLYYEDLSKEIEVHIKTRRNAGLIDLVEELNARKAIIDEHKRILSEIKEDIEKENGKFLRVKICYQRGFLKGLTHLTNTNILNKKIS